VFDEAARISRLARRRAEPLFQRCQRADAMAKFDRRTPQRGRQVQQRRPLPAQGQERAEADKENEAEMQDDNEVCRNAFDHGGSGQRKTGLHCFTSADRMVRSASVRRQSSETRWRRISRDGQETVADTVRVDAILDKHGLKP
jgi:hypothetical protein